VGGLCDVDGRSLTENDSAGVEAVTGEVEEVERLELEGGRLTKAESTAGGPVLDRPWLAVFSGSLFSMSKDHLRVGVVEDEGAGGSDGLCIFFLFEMNWVDQDKEEGVGGGGGGLWGLGGNAWKGSGRGTATKSATAIRELQQCACAGEAWSLAFRGPMRSREHVTKTPVASKLARRKRISPFARKRRF
jgi:hypothetical protein